MTPTKVMRIGVNLIPLRTAGMGGLEAYVRNLLKHLLVHDTSRRYILFTAWWSHDSVDFQDGCYEKILVVQEPRSGRRFERQIALRTFPRIRRLVSGVSADLHWWARRLKLDLWFCPMINLEPRQLSVPTVIANPDLQHEYYPEFFSAAELRARALMYRPSCEEATAVITFSAFSRQCLLEKYGLRREKVYCTHLAGGELPEPPDAPSVEVVREKHQLPDVYAFYPANFWPHKNHRMLVLALQRLRKTYGMPMHLVLTGVDMGERHALEDVIRHFQLRDQIHFLGYLEPVELRRLYEGATMLVLPSLFEGFGIPLVEAMALRCPVVASNWTSIPEIVGDAALLFDPRSPDSIAAAMFRLISDADLRQTLVARGLERARLFSWEKAADETLQVFDWAQSRS